MTTIADEMPTTAPEAMDAEWRRLGRFLWTGRRDGRPIGMIEQGRRFVLTDERGEDAGRYRSLADAQVAAADPAQRSLLEVGARRTVTAPLVAATASLCSGLALGTAALAALHLV